jgi:hypothetical protein
VEDPAADRREAGGADRLDVRPRAVVVGHLDPNTSASGYAELISPAVQEFEYQRQ